MPEPVREAMRSAYRKVLSEGGVPRKGQRVMIAEIAKAVANHARRGEDAAGCRLLAIQAPTGTGKTIAYGIGAILGAMASDLKVIISSATVQLQEQIVHKDLEALKRSIPGLRAALVKGRGRYACPVKVRDVAANKRGNYSQSQVACAKDLGIRLATGWSGDVDDLTEPPQGAEWSAMTNDRGGCSGRRCSAYSKCPYYKARTEVEEANVVVTNHALLLMDVRTGNKILPSMEKSVLVIDEAHELPEVAKEALASEMDVTEVMGRVAAAQEALASVRLQCRGAGIERDSSEALGALEGLAIEASRLAFELDELEWGVSDGETKQVLRFPMGALPKSLDGCVSRCLQWTSGACESLERIAETLGGEDGDDLEESVREGGMLLIGRSLVDMTNMRQLWELLGKTSTHSEPVAKWIERDPKTAGMRMFGTPVGVGAALHRMVWERCAAAVHVSATLTTVGGFSEYLAESGLGCTRGAKTLEVDSPFDYERQGTLTIPKTISSPKDARRHTGDLAKSLIGMLDAQEQGTGALVLFASWSQLKSVRDMMPERIQKWMQVQADGVSKRELLSRHRAAIDAGGRSVIFGTASFEQGVDLPGKYLTLVVVAKLQFAVPTDPVMETLKEVLDAQGRSFFDEVVVPTACRRLAQSVGRLLRTEKDEGRVVVADPRLSETKYGRKMLRALPPYRLEPDWVPEGKVAEPGGGDGQRPEGDVEGEAEGDGDWGGEQMRPF